MNAFYRWFVCNHINLTAQCVHQQWRTNMQSYRLIWTFIFLFSWYAHYVHCARAKKYIFVHWIAYVKISSSPSSIGFTVIVIAVAGAGIAIESNWRNLMKIRLFLFAILNIHKNSHAVPPIFRLLCVLFLFVRSFIYLERLLTIGNSFFFISLNYFLKQLSIALSFHYYFLQWAWLLWVNQNK